MRNLRVTGMLGGLGWASVLGACSGSYLPVGENGAGAAGMGAMSAAGGATNGAGQQGSSAGMATSGAGPQGSGAVGTGGSVGGDGGPEQGGGGSFSTTTTYYFSKIQTTEPGASATTKCLPRTLIADPAALPHAHLYQAMTTGCACDAPGYGPAPDAAVSDSVEFMRNEGDCDGGGPRCSDLCFCELLPAVGAALDACLNQPAVPTGSGWCYLSEDPPRGNADLLADCASHQRQILRLYGVPDQSLLVVTAAIHHSVRTESAPGDAPLGAPCLPETERDPEYNGFSTSEVSVTAPTPGCQSGICLVNHMQGRVSCPYGQSTEQAQMSSACLIPGSQDPVTVAVDSQRMERRAENTATCSKACAGPDDCPTGMECARVIHSAGTADASLESFCILAGTAYNPQNPPGPDTCQQLAASSSTSDPYPCGDPHPY
jgi:hypothetical protein